MADIAITPVVTPVVAQDEPAALQPDQQAPQQLSPDKENVLIEKVLPPCAGCGKVCADLGRCGRCKETWYCDRDCQVRSWPSHRQACELAAWQARENKRQAKYRQETKEYVASLSESEFKWKSWLGGHGPAVQVNEENLYKYCPGYDRLSPTPDSTTPTSTTTAEDPPKLHTNQPLKDVTATLPPSAGSASSSAVGKGKPRVNVHVTEATLPAFCPELNTPGTTSMSPLPLDWDLDPIKEGLGAKYPEFSWRQTTQEVELRIRLPDIPSSCP